MKKRILFSIVASAVLITACENENIEDIQNENLEDIQIADLSTARMAFDIVKDESIKRQYESQMAQLNADVENFTSRNAVNASGLTDKVGEIRIVTNMFSELNAQLASQKVAVTKVDAMISGGPSIVIVDEQFDFLTDSHFVPEDPRRGGDLTLEYNSIPVLSIANGIPTDPINDDAFERWENDVFCNTDVSIERVPNNNILNSALITIPGVTPVSPFSDINTVGFFPGALLEDLAGLDLDEGLVIQGLAFTLSFIDDAGNITDIDNDGFGDTAFIDIFYNGDSNWGLNVAGTPALDLASVITHENGHALGLDHFGALVEINGVQEYFPQAVMNALLLQGVDNNELQFTDEAGFCTVFSDWREFSY